MPPVFATPNPAGPAEPQRTNNRDNRVGETTTYTKRGRRDVKRTDHGPDKAGQDGPDRGDHKYHMARVGGDQKYHMRPTSIHQDVFMTVELYLHLDW